MDPVSALGLAGNILTFIDYTQKLLSKTIQVYRSVDGASADRRALENQLHDFIIVTTTLDPSIEENKKGKKEANPSIASKRQTLHSSPPTFAVSPWALDSAIKILVGHSTVIAYYAGQEKGQCQEADSVHDVAVLCTEVANGMLRRLETMKKGSMGKIWPSLKVALQELWKESEIKSMKQTLETNQRKLELHILVSLRKSINLLSDRQADQFDPLKTSMQSTIHELLGQNTVVGTPRRTVEMSPESLKNIADKQTQDKKEIINAVNHACSTRDLGGLDLSLLRGRDFAIASAAQQLSSQLLATEKGLLDSLKYPVMLDREEDIPEAERATFDWIFDDSESEELHWDNFSQWLPGNDSLYWVTGKAGSGKSTLMKYLFCHQRTREALTRWAGADPLVLAGFFFWNTGSQMQKTHEGLLRSLLYQVLSAHRELIPILFSDMESNIASDLWTYTRLKRVFGELIRQDTVPLRICFFIDGLDDYAGDHATIAALLKDVATIHSIKVCLSSRPLVVFEQSFEGLPRLMLQNLTFNDTKTYVTVRFTANAHMARLQKTDPGLSNRLSSEIVSKASGVFLWVKLVVNSLLEGLGSYDRSADLERRLREQPEDLMQLYYSEL